MLAEAACGFILDAFRTTKTVYDAAELLGEVVVGHSCSWALVSYEGCVKEGITPQPNSTPDNNWRL